MRFATILFISPALLFGQWGGEQAIQASIRGDGGEYGKCTAEVEVDDVAEVVISGAAGRIRNLAGRGAGWIRLDCNSPMPRNMAGFRFRGIDGRGRQTLVQDPRSGRGVAVVRIDDPKSGPERYTFDLEWRFDGGGAWDRDGLDYAGGWDRGWGNQIAYRGHGRGGFARAGGQHYEIYAVDVRVNRNSGQVAVLMDTNMGRDALSFTGRIQRVSAGVIYADVRAGANRGEVAGAYGAMRISIGRDRRVRSIDMDGAVAGRRFRLDWQD
ncbi:MAG: hypothetical protein IT165_18260 [Bryobacterales bacterium]|nr:hypothetical protein [Bryobacterales bacterium]